MDMQPPAVPKQDLEAAIRRLFHDRPQWFRKTVYVAAHRTRLNQWHLQVYEPTAHYNPDQIYEEIDDPPRYWWWMVRPSLGGIHDLNTILENVTISPILVAVLHLGDALLEPDLTTLNIYDPQGKP